MPRLFSIVQELLLLAPVPLLVLVNVADAGAERGRPAVWAGVPVTRRVARVVLALIPAILGVLGLVDLGAGLFSESARQAQTSIVPTGLGLVLLAVVLVVVMLPGSSPWLVRLLPLAADRVTDLAALVMALAVIGTQVITQATTDVLADAAKAGQELTRVDLVLNEVPFLVAAVIGVGFLTRRDGSTVVKRLGLNLPAPWALAGALAAAVAFFGFGVAVDAIAHHVTPGLAKKVDAANSTLFGGLADPLGVLTIAAAAGICEEVLFRGAIQPRLGLVLTSLLFASVHSQYGLSFDALAVFVLAIGLGLIRIAGGTTVAIATHVAYDALVGSGLGRSTWPWLGLFGAIALAVFALGLRGSRARPRTES